MISTTSHEIVGASNRSKKASKLPSTRGRWTQYEHDLFLVGYAVHGKLWRKIVPIVKTRTAVQIRTHAQKYFQSLRRMENIKCHEEETDSEISSASESITEGSPSKKYRMDSLSSLSYEDCNPISDPVYANLEVVDLKPLQSRPTPVSSMPLLAEPEDALDTDMLSPYSNSALLDTPFVGLDVDFISVAECTT